MVTDGRSPPVLVTVPLRRAELAVMPVAAELTTDGGVTAVVVKLAVVGAQEPPAEFWAKARKK